MFCPQCGKEVPNHATFCTNCGHQMKQSTAPNTNTPTMATDRPVPPVSRPTPSPVAAQTPSPSVVSTPPAPSVVPPHPNTFTTPSRPQIEGMTYGQFILAFILFSIPLVNIILMIKWGFISAPTKTHQNFTRAILTFTLISLVFMLLFSLVGGGLFMSLFEEAIL